MATTRLVIHRGPLYELRREPGVRADLDRRAGRVRDAAAGSDQKAVYLTSSTQGKKSPQGRWRAAVFTANFAAIRDNTKNNTLMRALNAARG